MASGTASSASAVRIPEHLRSETSEVLLKCFPFATLSQVATTHQYLPMPEQSARKRLRSHRSAKEKAKNKAIQETQRHYLDILPIELLALVLSYVNSPKDVLAVTRCNKALCTKLLSKSQNFIWKHARQVCSVEPMSPPPPGWSEAAYAAFIFDGGFCEVRGPWLSALSICDICGMS